MKVFFPVLCCSFLFVFQEQILAQELKMGISASVISNKTGDTDKTELVVYSVFPGLAEKFKSAEIPFRKYFGHYYRIQVNSSQAGQIRTWDEISFTEAPGGKPFSLNDSMVSNNRIRDLHSGLSGFKTSYSGKGVLLGFIDTGIDFLHPDFLDSAGNTRILKIWDQAATPTIPGRIPIWGYGQVWDSSDINSGTCPHDDDVLSHGTNVAGIAAGNGLALNKYYGVAGSADIIVVASDFSSTNWLQTVADGVEYIFSEADKAGKPCVVNISAGDYLGSHDGSDLAALRIDSMIKAKKGRLLVAAAGNAGNLFFHLGYPVTADTSFTWFQYNASSFLGYGSVYYQLWADTADFSQVSFAFGANKKSPSYQFRGRTAFDQISNRLNVLYQDSIMAGTRILARVETFAQLMGDKYLLEIHMKQPDSSNYLFSLLATGTGRFDIWTDTWLGMSKIYKSPLPSASLLPEIQFYKAPDTLQTMVSSFTCLPSVITVANYVNRNSYTDVNNVLRTFPVVPGTRAANSSLGPNRIGQQKPDISASGDYTLTANRLASIPLHIANGQSDRIAVGGKHKRNGGTSMAAPVISGIAALLLEECGNLGSEDIRGRLIQNVYTDSLTGTVPNYSYGYGKADAAAVMNSLYYKAEIQPGNQIDLCESSVVSLSANAGMLKYNWSTGDTTSQIDVDTAAMITVTTLDSNWCRSLEDTCLITLYPKPLKPLITQLNATTLESTLAFQYQWYKNGTILSGETSRQLVLPASGYYQVEVSDSNLCSEISDSLVSYLNVKKELSENVFAIYPNPSSNGLFHLNVDQSVSGELFLLRIFQNDGNEIYNNWIQNGGVIDLSAYPSAIYFYTISGEEGLTGKGKLIRY